MQVQYETEHKNTDYYFAGVMPHVPRMLPVLISDPEMREKVSDTFTSQEFMDNLEGYFVDNIKVRKPRLWQYCTLLVLIDFCPVKSEFLTWSFAY